MGGGTADFTDGARLLRFYSPIKGLLIESMNGATMTSEQYIFNLRLSFKDVAHRAQTPDTVSAGVEVELHSNFTNHIFSKMRWNNSRLYSKLTQIFWKYDVNMQLLLYRNNIEVCQKGLM